MISALLKNIDDDPTLDIYVELTAYPHRQIAPYELVTIVYDFLLGSLIVRELNEIPGSRLELSLLSLLGAQHEHADSGLAVASSSKGQVTYLSLLETLSPYPQNMYRRVVLPGWLQQKDRRYNYITGRELNQFDLRKSMVQSDDYQENPFPDVNSTENFSWMLSADDDYLQLYLAPYLTMNASLDIRSCMNAFSYIEFDKICSYTCASLSNYLPELRYCRTLGAALSADHSYVFRVFTFNKNRIDFLYALAAVGEHIKATERISATSFLGVVCQNICLACACERMSMVLEVRTLQDRKHPTFVVLIIQ